MIKYIEDIKIKNIENNVIYCYDCIKLMQSMEDEYIDLLITDPPYGMNYQSNWRTATPKFDKIIKDDDLMWFPAFSKELFRIMKNNSHTYFFCNDYAAFDFRKELISVGLNVKRMLVWIKNNHTSGDLEGDYANRTEFILFAHKGRKKLNGKRETNDLHFNRVSTSTMVHPTQKPIELCQFLIKKSSNEFDIVFDPFAGSFTTALAAEQLGRRWIACDVSEEYCKIGEKRINDFRKQNLLI